MLIAFFTPLVAGLLLACAFLPPPAHWLAWVGLIPVAAAIARRNHVAASYVGMYCGGLAFNLMTTDWIRTLEGGAGLTGPSAPDWVFQAQLVALFWPLTLWLGRLLAANCSLPMSIVLPVVWVTHEFLLRQVWTIIDATGWQLYFLGYAIAEHHYIVQIADLGGVSGLTFVAACVNGGLWDAWCLLRQRLSGPPAHFRLCPAALATAGALTAFVLAFASCGYGVWAVRESHASAGPRVALMPDSLLRAAPAELPWQPGSVQAPDILLWSELAYSGPPVDAVRSSDAAPAEPKAKSATERALEDWCRYFGLPIVVGCTRYENEPQGQVKYNSSAFIDPQAELVGWYDKIWLVPWTEFTPWEGLSHRQGSNYRHGKNCPVFVLNTASGVRYHFAMAICYDVAFPQLFRRYMRSAADVPEFFLVCSSERTDTTGRMSRHVLTLARVCAIECRRSIVRNVNNGLSGRIDSTGRLLDESLPWRIEAPAYLESLPVDSRMTLYVLWGDWIASLAVTSMLLAAIWTLFRRATARGLHQRPAQYVTVS